MFYVPDLPELPEIKGGRMSKQNTDGCCIECTHYSFERHEDYIGQPMWYLGDCEYKLKRVEGCSCKDFNKGAPRRLDCRIGHNGAVIVNDDNS